jgi:hypothetical protein
MRSYPQLVLRLLVASLVVLFSLSAIAEEVVLTEEGGGSAASSGTVTEEPSAPSNADAGVMVRPFEGAKSQTIHQAVVTAMESAGVILIPPGFEGGVALGNKPGPYVEVARKNAIKAYIHGKTSMSKRGWTLQMQVRDGRDGQIVAEPKLSAGWLPGLLKKIDQALMKALESPLAQTGLPGTPGASTAPGVAKAGDGIEAVTLVAEPGSGAAAGPPVADDGAHDDDEPDAAPKPIGPPSAFDGSVGFGVIMRTQDYNKPIGDIYENNLQPHGVTAPALRVGGHWYPGAHALDGPLAHTGIALSYTQSVGGATLVNSGGASNKFVTTFTELNVGLRGRIPLRGDLELGLNGGWGFQSLVLDGDNVVNPGQEQGDPGVVPDTKYTYYRFGPDVAFEFGVPIELGVFYRMISLNTDDGFFSEDRWFPHAAGIGLDGYLNFLIAFSDTIEFKLGGEARYYGIKANSGAYDDNTDNYNAHGATPGLTNAVAAGAHDLYLGAIIGVSYTLPGVAR